MNKICIASVVVIAASVTFADRGPWTFTAGPAWRSSVRMETSGIGHAAQLPESHTVSYGDFDPLNQSTWSGHNIHAPVDVPASYSPYPGQQTWAIDATRTLVDVMPGAEGRIDSSSDSGAMGVNFGIGYDFYRGEAFSIGAGLRFAGYWNMKTTCGGDSSGGTIRTREYTDMFLFMTGIDASDPAPSAGDVYLPEATPDYMGTVPTYDNTDIIGARTFDSRLRTDFYQIGIGPRFTWHALTWLDAYAGIDILVNFAYSKLDADGSSSTQTDCLIGFGGNLGLVGNITDNIGVYGQVGYEWVDKSEVSAGGFSADIDYSSLVLTAGLQFRF